MNKIFSVSFAAMLYACIIIEAFGGNNNFDQIAGRGLLGAIALELVDSAGSPIANIPVSIAFETTERTTIREVITDAAGKVSVEGWYSLGVIVDVNSAQYHRRHQEYITLTADPAKMANGKWVPFEKSIKLQVYEKKHPKAPVYCHVSCKFCLTNDTFGISFSGMPVSRLDRRSNGSLHADDLICGYELSSGASNFVARLYIPSGGFTIIPKMDIAAYGISFPYELPEKGYTETFKHIETLEGGGHLGREFNPSKEALAFRLPVKDEGGGIRYKYGIITRMSFSVDETRDAGLLTMEYVINDLLEDRNCEF